MVVFLKLGGEVRGSFWVAMGTSGNLLCCLRGVQHPFEFRGVIRGCSQIAAGELGLISS